VQLLELADERQRLVDLAFRIVGTAEHEGELGDDAVLAASGRHLQGVIDRIPCACVEHFVAGGLGADVRHAQPLLRGAPRSRR
jgi:hypothetical protein